MHTPLTHGAHHIGLTASKLEASAAFFTQLLGWREVRRRDDYPAIFVSDGKVMVTLWATKETPFNPFNRHRNIGLHHVAFAMGSDAELNALYQRLASAGVDIEFAPEQAGIGPARHMMCYEPSGIRVEFYWPGV